MLYLTRKVGESIMVNGDIEVTVVEVRGRSVRIGFTFPTDVTVLRREVFDRIQAENLAAAEATPLLLDALEPKPEKE
jgi:carbon storage regulator